MRLSIVRAGYIGGMHYLTTGEAERALVLLHETPLSARSFTPVLEMLGERSIPAIAFDTPGYGNSQPAASASIENYAAAIENAIRALGVISVVVCGIHTGAAIAIEIAARKQLPVAGLVLSGIPLMDDTARARLRDHLAGCNELSGEDAILRDWRDRCRRWHNAPRELLIQALAEEMAVFERRHSGFEAVMAYDLAARVREVVASVLVLNGEYDSLAAIDAAEALRLFPQAELRLLAGLGGQPQWTWADIYLENLLQFATPFLR